MSIEHQRITDVQLVLKEKDAMVAVGKELFALSKPYPEKIDEAAFRSKALELINHLTNIAGFCDKDAKHALHGAVRQFAAMMLDPNRLELFTDTNVKALIPLIIGVQVDFTKKPFRVAEFSIEILGTKVKGILKR